MEGFRESTDNRGNLRGPENLPKLGLCGLKVHEGLREFTDECSLDGTLGENGWYPSTVAVALTASDATSCVPSVAYRIDGGAQQEYTNPFTVDGDGTHTVEYFSTDLAVNKEAVKSLDVKIDPTPLTLSISSPASAAFLATGDIEVTWSASDATSGIDHFAVVLDEGTPSSCPPRPPATPSPAWSTGPIPSPSPPSTWPGTRSSSPSTLPWIQTSSAVRGPTAAAPLSARPLHNRRRGGGGLASLEEEGKEQSVTPHRHPHRAQRIRSPRHEQVHPHAVRQRL